MDDDREDIEAEESIPPWERPGCFRRDCEPHRGNLLASLACAGLTLGCLALYPLYGLVFGLLGIPVSLCNRYLAKADLAKMQAGRMNPYGEGVTASAKNMSTLGLAFSIAGTVVWGGLLLLSWWTQCRLLRKLW
ncbi:MAG TPA: hypothetical protein VH643_20250 [Gemmataceae bacterium]|jgi:hypothetical protein